METPKHKRSNDQRIWQPTMTASNKESNLWKRLSTAMIGYWLADRIESGTANGIPDVFFSIPKNSGWMELKVIDKFPVKSDTKVKIDHFYPEQKFWIRTRGETGGNVWLFVFVAETGEYFLFPWHIAHRIEELTKGEWRLLSSYWADRIDPKNLYDRLLDGCGNKFTKKKVGSPLG
jgi:hypothetical protein